MLTCDKGLNALGSHLIKVILLRTFAVGDSIHAFKIKSAYLGQNLK
jgi:hypothetical protein